MSGNITEIHPETITQRLAEIPNPPPRLFYRGTPPHTTNRYVAIIGDRLHSDYGAAVCKNIINNLAGYPITIVSGLTIGIDSITQDTARTNNMRTITVAGSGLDDTVLQKTIPGRRVDQNIQQGATLLSEFQSTTHATSHTLTARNRIIAGIAELIIVIECSYTSPARITARLAIDYNREVGAVPHPVFSETGAGTNVLLRQGAHVLRNAGDVLEILNIERTETNNTTKPLTTTEEMVYNTLQTPKTILEIEQITNLQQHQLQTALATLHMKHLIDERMGVIAKTAKDSSFRV